MTHGAVQQARSIEALRAVVREWRRAGDRVALVPTMGALHSGHLALVERGFQEADRVVVSIFVNPTQFAPNEDFTKYPRTEEADLAALAEVGADLAFLPQVIEMYPPGAATTVSLTGPATVGLEDRFRPTHFAGVATIVAKLFCQALPDVAIFGEKDYQQLQVVTRMAADLDLPVKVIGHPTVRDADGLALSSRNRYLSAENRAKAKVLPDTIRAAINAMRAGTPITIAMAEGTARLTAAGFEVDYLETRDATTLAPVEAYTPDRLRVLAAAKLGATRLIDNWPA
jgi:pantoate--beta-alanine ligase